MTGPKWSRWAALAAAIFVLDASITFENIWPTPGIRWAGGVSVELAVCVLALAVIASTPALLASLSTVWMLLAAGRYAEVTAPALYGRDVNLYWDLRLIPNVTAMVVRVVPVWVVALVIVSAAALLALLYRLFRWAFARVVDSLSHEPERRVLIVASSAAIALFGAQRTGAPGAKAPGTFPTPVTQTYGRQAALVLAAVHGSTSLPPSPRMESTFAGVQGAEVLLVFVESYGAVSDRPEVAARLTESRRGLDEDIRRSGREVASAYVESPTFGGSSWLAHVSLLTGIEVRDPYTNALLMTQHRDTLVRAFSRHGFRTIALMPGLRQPWPEGAFYGFDEIYGAARLAYTGPEFGWFALPDQFSLARLDVLEAHDAAAPRFVVFPTISTHFPFSPTPPYQPDWSRMLADKPYDGPAIVRAYSHQPDWMNFVPAYAEALSYDFAVLGGYLRRRADRDLVMILIGDHQPPAAVSGEGVSWDVPVHVITSRQGVLARLEAHGFQTGLKPERPAVARMHALLPILLDAFGGDE